MMTEPRPIRSIVVASDLSEVSLDVVRAASELAVAGGATLHAVHAHEEPSMASGEREILVTQRQIHEKRAALTDALNVHPTTGRVRGVARVDVGSAADVILRETRDLDGDLIVLGAHRHRGVADRFRGSTAEEILRQSAVPCLILNGPLRLPFARIVVPSDFSEPAQHALETALSWTRVGDGENAAEVTLAHVLDSSVEVEAMPSMEQEAGQKLDRAVREAREATATHAAVRVRVLQGDPAAELLEEARESGADLVVIGTHGDRVLVRALLGSVSSAMVRHSPIPVLLVPRPGGPKVATEEKETVAER